jgi:hypothetical protein
MRGSILSGCIGFVRSSIGLVTRPYETYRRIVNHGSLWELLPLAVLLSCYFAIASLVKTAAFRPYVLTKQFILLATAVFLTYALTVLFLWLVSKVIRGKGDIRSLALAWGYTLIPTLLWFLATSLLYVIFPPPRTGRPLGVLFSALYLSFSTALFFWKAMLSYLTLRFGMRLDLWRIIAVFFIVGGVMAMYSIGMYRLGIFKIPFI